MHNLYEWEMSQKLPVYGFKRVEENISLFSEDFREKYTEDSGEVYILEVDIQYPEKLVDLHNNLPVWSERMKIEKL